MSNSKLVDYTKISPNKTSPRNHKIDTITIHCVVGQCSVETLGNVFAPTSRRASSNYGIGYDGRIGMYVEEKDRSWCSSSASNDNRAITIEVASDTKHPYKVRDAAYKALIDLCTDICKRNGIKELKWKADKSLIGKVEQQNMTVHRWFANKACPGDYLYNLHGQIAAEVNARLGVVSDTTPDTNAALEYAVGDVVTFKGTKHYASSNGTNGKTCKPGEARVTSVAKTESTSTTSSRPLAAPPPFTVGWMPQTSPKQAHPLQKAARSRSIKALKPTRAALLHRSFTVRFTPSCKLTVTVWLSAKTAL